MKEQFFSFFVFLLYHDVYFKYTQRYKNDDNQRTQNFILEKNCRQIQFTKEKSYYSMKHRKEKDLLLPVTKLIEKTPDASNNKEYYQ